MLVLVEHQGLGDRFQHLDRGASGESLLQAGVVGDAHAGQLGRFFPAQPDDPPAWPELAQPQVFWAQSRAPGPQELAERARSVYNSSIRGLGVAQPHPARGRIRRDWLALVRPAHPRRHRQYAPKPGDGPWIRSHCGDVTVTRVKEYYGSVARTPAEFFPKSPKDMWQEHRGWMAPDFWNEETNECVAAIQTWLLRSEGRTILVDTGVGNHKDRPNTPLWNRLDTDFLGNLAAAGVRPADVDLVINPHLHNDHVGWNTQLDGRSWVPTFPNATYLMSRPDFDFWNPANGHVPVLGRGNQNVFEDSVTPVHEAGLTQLWDGSYRIDKNLRLDLAPGHTPGSSVLILKSGDDRALFVGDLVHTALQLVEPEINSCFCEDPVESRATRHKLLGRAAETNALVFPAHLGGHGAAEVERNGSKFAIKQWAGFPRMT